MPRVTGRTGRGWGNQRDLCLMAYQDFRPSRGWDAQTWVGWRWFAEIVADPRFWNALINTLVLGFLSLLMGFIFPLLFALFLNELRLLWLRRTLQTLSSLPHYLSWVVVSGMVANLLSTDGGPLNLVLVGAVLLVLSAARLVSSGFEKPFLLGNAVVLGKSEVLDLYALNQGVLRRRVSYGMALGIMNSLVSLALILLALAGAKGLLGKRAVA